MCQWNSQTRGRGGVYKLLIHVSFLIDVRYNCVKKMLNDIF